MNKIDISKYYKIDERYIEELFLLQSELVKLQKHIADNRIRLAIIFEGRDAAGKGAAITRFTQFLNPQFFKSVAVGKPTKREKGQWYFQRYIKRLPNSGEIVFFDRSWYNRAVVEPVMGFCSNEQYQLFLKQVLEFEKMIIDDGIKLIKFWFSIDNITQKNKIQDRIASPLEKWKVSPVDLAAEEKWEEFTKYKEAMFAKTSTSYSPWLIVQAKERELMRIQAMRYILTELDYPDKSSQISKPDMIISKDGIIGK